MPFALVLLAPGRGQLSFSHAGPPAFVPRGGPTPMVNLPLPPLFRLISSCSRPAPLGVCKHLPLFGRRANYWKGRYLESSSNNSSSADHHLQSRVWLRELSTTAAPGEAWRCCEDRLVSRVGESVRKHAAATGLSIIFSSHTARHGHEPQ